MSNTAAAPAPQLRSVVVERDIPHPPEKIWRALTQPLAYTWGAYGLESVVTWTLTPTSTGTHLRMEQAGFRPDQQQAYGGAKVGWPRFIASLEQVLARMA